MSHSTSALRSGKRDKAHQLLRQAASLSPYDEAIWWALLDVVDTEDDRVVCLENILAINPENPEAQRLHRMARIGINIKDLTPKDPAKSLEPLPATVRPLPPRQQKARSKPAPKPRRRWLRLLILMLVFGLLAAALGVVLSILLYGGLIH
ncbi:MAG: hypothetical protein KC547_02010 [Anaerolineae bacterium]|nr:hypothetical protein [Anaerolineae bacterium]